MDIIDYIKLHNLNSFQEEQLDFSIIDNFNADLIDYANSLFFHNIKINFEEIKDILKVCIINFLEQPENEISLLCNQVLLTDSFSPALCKENNRPLLSTIFFFKI